MPSRKNKFGGNNWRVTIGLTGGIGAGKSTVLNGFRELGAFTLDSDRFVKEILNRAGVIKKLKKIFGTEIIKRNGKIRKADLAGLVFANPQKRKILEKIIHPLVEDELNTALTRKRGLIAVCEVPLLFEVGWDKRFDYSLAVAAKNGVTRSRMKARGYNKNEVFRRMKAQWPISKKIKNSDFVIYNNGSRADLKTAVRKLWNLISEKSTRYN